MEEKEGANNQKASFLQSSNYTGGFWSFACWSNEWRWRWRWRWWWEGGQMRTVSVFWGEGFTELFSSASCPQSEVYQKLQAWGSRESVKGARRRRCESESLWVTQAEDFCEKMEELKVENFTQIQVKFTRKIQSFKTSLYYSWVFHAYLNNNRISKEVGTLCQTKKSV